MNTTLTAGTVYEVSMRVKVCDSTVGVEPNCKQYSQGWKPEGLIQKYSDRIRYSVFGYLNDPTVNRDGGALRARQKFVGPNKIDPATSLPVANPNVEWDNTAPACSFATPIPRTRPAPPAAVGQTIADSGVMNYVNKFGEMTTPDDKTLRPGQRAVLRRHSLPEASRQRPRVHEPHAARRRPSYILADGFPVITSWDDPMQYYCQSNAILGIGDVNTWNDKDLPGNSADTNSEPTMPASVSADKTVNVVTATQKVATLEGITINTPFSGRENSAYIAGLAYDSHTKDMRSDLSRLANRIDLLGGRARSAGAAAEGEQPILARHEVRRFHRAGRLRSLHQHDPRSLSLSGARAATCSTGDPRPDHFYVASEADKMVESLTRAFAQIAANSQGSSSSLAANSTRLDTDTRTFQAQFTSGTWSGDVLSYVVQSDGSLASTPSWQAGTKLLDATWSSRTIYVYNPQGSGAGKFAAFTWANLGSDAAGRARRADRGGLPAGRPLEGGSAERAAHCARARGYSATSSTRRRFTWPPRTRGSMWARRSPAQAPTPTSQPRKPAELPPSTSAPTTACFTHSTRTTARSRSRSCRTRQSSTASSSTPTRSTSISTSSMARSPLRTSTTRARAAGRRCSSAHWAAAARGCSRWM